MAKNDMWTSHKQTSGTVDLRSYLVNVEKNLKKDGGKARLMNLLIQVLGGRLISVV